MTLVEDRINGRHNSTFYDVPLVESGTHCRFHWATDEDEVRYKTRGNLCASCGWPTDDSKLLKSHQMCPQCVEGFRANAAHIKNRAQRMIHENPFVLGAQVEAEITEMELGLEALVRDALQRVGAKRGVMQ